MLGAGDGGALGIHGAAVGKVTFGLEVNVDLQPDDNAGNAFILDAVDESRVGTADKFVFGLRGSTEIEQGQAEEQEDGEAHQVFFGHGGKFLVHNGEHGFQPEGMGIWNQG